MKLKWTLTILIIIFALGILIVAVALSSDNNVPTGKKISVNDIKKQLVQTTSSSITTNHSKSPNSQTVVKSTSKPESQTSTIVNTPQKSNTNTLINTGPGNEVILFIIVSTLSTAAHMIWKSRKTL